MLPAIIMCIIAYLLGSVSTAVLVSQLLKLPDPRTSGSQNPGTTNVLRIGGKLPAILTLIGDMLKGIIPVLIAAILAVPGYMLGVIVLAAVLGHIFPIFFHFKGGKGVATALGGYFAISPLIGISAVIIWLVVVFFSRFSSLASLTMVSLAPICAAIYGNFAFIIPAILIALLIIWKHKENIQRLRAKTESKINW